MKKNQSIVTENLDEPKISLQEFIDGAPYSRVLIAGLESWCKRQDGPRKRSYANWVQAFEEFSSLPSE